MEETGPGVDLELRHELETRRPDRFGAQTATRKINTVDKWTVRAALEPVNAVDIAAR